MSPLLLLETKKFGVPAWNAIPSDPKLPGVVRGIDWTMMPDREITSTPPPTAPKRKFPVGSNAIPSGVAAGEKTPELVPFGETKEMPSWLE
jgi:hypothetical protein